MKWAWLSLVLVGCAPLTETERFQREYDHAVNEERWAECQRIYKNARVPTVSDHAHIAGWPHKPWQVRDDLLLNNCDSLLKDW